MGGFNYENNKKNPRIYKNSEELTLCSVFVKEFKISLHPILCHLNDGSLHQRLMQLFLKIKALDKDSVPGSRNVAQGLKTLKGQQLLREFVFTPKAGIRQHFGNPRIDALDFSLEWARFNPAAAKFPKGATHFELFYCLLVYDAATNTFVTYEAPILRRSKEDRSEKLVQTLKGGPTNEEGLQYIPVLGLRFMEVLGEEEYANFGKDAVGIEVLGVYMS